jgi:hypothetical protein
LTKVSFGNGEHCSATFTNLSHSHCVLAWESLVTFWSFRLYTTMTFPKVRTFILTWYCCWGFFSEIVGFPSLAFFCHQTMHLLKMFGQQQFGTIWNNAHANFTFPFWPNLCPFFVLPNQIRWTKGVQEP